MKGKYTQTLTVDMLVWFASKRPLTRCGVWTYGDRLDRATWMLAGPQGINWAIRRSRILCSDLCTSVGSTSPERKRNKVVKSWFAKYAVRNKDDYESDGGTTSWHKYKRQDLTTDRLSVT